MAGNEEAEIAYLIKLSQDFGNKLNTSKCEKRAGMYTLQLSFMKTLEYPMVVTHLDENTCNLILSTSLTPALHKVGMSMNFPKAVLFGPELFQGFQLMYSFFLQEISHITTHLQESVCGSQTGNCSGLQLNVFAWKLGFNFSWVLSPSILIAPMCLIVGVGVDNPLIDATLKSECR